MKNSTSEFSGRRVTVMGLGQFGGGVGVVRFLLEQEALVTLTDLQTEEQLAKSLSQIDVNALHHLVLSEHREEDFRETDLVVFSPGVDPAKNRFTLIAIDAGIPLTTEMNLFWERCRARKIVVTGTVGKSTTTALIHHLLQTSGISCRLGGNIGISLLPEVDSFGSDDWVVLELSSFQLAHLATLKPRPEIAVVTNFHANHLDWHENLDDYRTAKQVALQWQTEIDATILNVDDADVRDWHSTAKRSGFGTSQFTGNGVQIAEDRFLINTKCIQGEIAFDSLSTVLNQPHQHLNISAAIAALGAQFSIPIEKIIQSLQSFRFLPHRLEVVAEHEGILFINDSKATTPEASIAALKSMNRPTVLIAGGATKQVDLTELCKMISRKTKAVALIGETATEMARLLSKADSKVRHTIHADLRSAFDWSLNQAQAGETVLLSPGCSSFGEFVNYEDRGSQFCKLVDEFKNQPQRVQRTPRNGY